MADFCGILLRHQFPRLMDVYSIEPLPADSELLQLDNIMVTPHLAAVTADTFEPTVRRMFDNMARVARGEPVPAKDLVV